MNKKCSRCLRPTCTCLSDDQTVIEEYQEGEFKVKVLPPAVGSGAHWNEQIPVGGSDASRWYWGFAKT